MNNITEFLESHGPLTGKEFIEKTNINALRLWKICNNSDEIVLKTVGRRYLRLDKQVEGWARLSPSIIREFYSYSIIGLKQQIEAILKKAELLQQEIIEISKKKYQLALSVMKKAVDFLEDSQLILDHSCFIISGDVAYDMAHLEPRPEFTTGELVNGSDLDIVIITKDLPDYLIKSLDSSIYAQKAYLLKNPSCREEIDYIIKTMATMKSQLKFDCFKSMVASKVLYEGKFLYGNLELFNEVQKIISEEGIPQRIALMEEKAIIHRENAGLQLLKCDDALFDEEIINLFCTKEENKEFF
jgi:hypothetical protein